MGIEVFTGLLTIYISSSSIPILFLFFCYYHVMQAVFPKVRITAHAIFKNIFQMN